MFSARKIDDGFSPPPGSQKSLDQFSASKCFQAEQKMTDQNLCLNLIPIQEIPLLNFLPGKLWLLKDGAGFSSQILPALCVNACKASIRVIWVDGGNSIDPYAISAAARASDLQPEEILKEICVIRAFTAYQLKSIILKKLLIGRRDNPTLLIVSSICDHLLDSRVNSAEALEILRKEVAKIEWLTNSLGMFTIITTSRMEEKKRRFLSSELEKITTEILEIEVKHRKKKKIFRLVFRKNNFWMDFAFSPLNQLTLDKFDVIYEEEKWGEP